MSAEPERQAGESELAHARRLLSASAIRALAADRWLRYRPWLDLPLLALMVVVLVALFAPPASRLETVPPLGSSAPETIRAPRDLTLVDQAATAKARQEALNQVAPVFDYNRETYFALIDQVNKATHDLVAAKSRQGSDVTSRRLAFQQDLGQPVRPATFDLIESLHDPDDLAGAIAYFLNFGIDGMIVAEPAELPAKGPIFVRDAGKPGRGREVSDTSQILDLSQLRRTMWAHAADAPYGEARVVRTFAIETAAALARPTLTADAVATEAARAAAVARVAPVVIHIPAGELVVRAGDPVTMQVRERIRQLDEALGARARWRRLIALGALVLGLVALGVWHLRRADRAGRPTRKHIYIGFGATLVAALIGIAMYYAGVGIAEGLGFNPQAADFLPPLALASVLCALLLGPRAGLLPGVGLALLMAYRVEGSVLLAAYYVIGSLAGILGASRCHRRADLMRAGLFVGGVQALMVPAIVVLEGASLNLGVLGGMLCALLSGLGAVAVAAVVLPVFEQIFEEATDLKLLELAAADNPLLKQLALQSPGTYYHSMIMANLAEAAADAIGAKALQCRVMALYHDLGKMVRPSYFAENQRGTNIHDRLPPELSARIIFAHIKDGIDIARKNHLGRAVLDAITQHQGTTLLRVFYVKAQEKAEAQGASVDEAEFRYPGPRPRSKESGILLLADSTEAATRALKDPAPAELTARIRKVVSDKLSDNQLDECALTMRDLNRIEAAFARVLTLGVYHSRIEYPPMPKPAPRKEPHDASEDRSDDQQRGGGQRGVGQGAS